MKNSPEFEFKLRRAGFEFGPTLCEANGFFCWYLGTFLNCSFSPCLCQFPLELEVFSCSILPGHLNYFL